MSDKREPRKNGEKLQLGGIIYHIDAVEGMGGSSIVYKASYEDNLNRSEQHSVLIKELFPYAPQNYIFRDEDGTICCEPEGLELMAYSQLRFKQGNQVNLELLQKMPSQMSGNINSFEAYGTYYSVLSLHGGSSLDAVLARENTITNLRTAAVKIKQILDSLQCFHRNGFLHLDISPDNILILPQQVLLIDYNSVWNIRANSFKEHVFSEKQGYSPPEIILRNFDSIDYPADTYSVCATFFRILAGRTLSYDEIIEKSLPKILSGGLPLLEGTPKSAQYKVFQILSKGLHTLPRKRYQDVDDLRKDIIELIDRIDRVGISHSAIWESSRSNFKRYVIRQNNFLPRRIAIEGNVEINTNQLYDSLAQGSLIMLKGAGGMGKTTLLYELWKNSQMSYSPKSPVTVYLPLNEYQEQDDGSEYIRQSILKKLSYNKEESNYRDAMHELEKFIDDNSSKHPALILLLDGLNESGEHRETLLKEIEMLGSKTGIGILITDRTDDVKGFALKTFKSAELLALEAETVKQELSKHNCHVPDDDQIRHMLSNPMMLELYENVFRMRLECSDESEPDEGIHNANDLVSLFLKQLREKQMRVDSGNQGLQLCHKYILEHLLPDIARELSRKNQTVLKLEDVFRVAANNYKNLYRIEFGKGFPEYLGKTRTMLTVINDEAEWFDFAVTEQLIGNFGLLARSENNFYRLVHENFGDYLTLSGKKNYEVLRKGLLKKNKKRAILVAAAVLLLSAGGLLLSNGGILNINAPADADSEGIVSYSEKEQKTIDRAVTSMQANLGALSNQIMAQRDILDMAEKNGIMENDPEDIADLQWWMGNKLTFADSLTLVDLRADLVERLIDIDPDFPVEQLQSLCNKPVEMDLIMKQALSDLDRMLCKADTSYKDSERKEDVIDSYRQYLDAYTQYVFYEFDYVLQYIAPERASEILDDSQYTKIFRNYFITVGVSEQNVDNVKAAMNASLEQLKDAQNNMKTNNFQIQW